MSKRRKHHHKPKAHAAPAAVAAAGGAVMHNAGMPIKRTGTGAKKSPQQGDSGGGGDSAEPQEASAPEAPEAPETPEAPEAPEAAEEGGGEEADTEEESSNEQPGYEAPRLPPVRFPITSSHLINGRVRTASVCITPNECKIVHCSSPQPQSDFGAEIVAAKHRGTIQKLGIQQHYKKAVTDLVKRARHGDQNAMAIIALTRENAIKGLPRAQTSVGIMKSFIEQNPVRDDNTFAGEEDNKIITPDTTGAIMMANGPPLTDRRMLRIIIAIPMPADRNIFANGVSKWREAHEEEHVLLSSRLNALQTSILRTGRTMGYARALQRVRDPNIPIAAFDKKVAWELGESL